MPPPFRQMIRMIADGESVSAAVTNRPLGDLAGNTDYLLDRLNAATLGAALYRYAAPAAPGVQVGMPVYWDATNGRFDRALAAIAIDPNTSTAVPQPSADAVGVVTATYAAGTVDVCTAGVTAVDLTAAAGADAPAGRYYLSTRTPGALVAQSPSISVPVLFAFGDGTACVCPQIRQYLTDHVHFVFDLTCAPAGTTSPPAAGQRHVISADDPTKPGWLNASDATFAGLAPAGAAFGYNLAQHPGLRAVWPPLPAGGAVLVWDKGPQALDAAGNPVGGTLVPLGTAGGLAVVDQNGIWWMSDCYGDVPWPVDYNSASPPAPPAADASPPTCPRPAAMRLTLGYYVSLFASRSAIVTQLRGVAPITVTDWSGAAAAAGALEVGIDWSAMTDAGDVDGAEVLKSFAGGAFSKGFVAEGVQLAGGGLSATASRTSAGTTATATATVAGGAVTGLALAAGGYGYVTPPTVTLSGGGGSGATAIAVVANGAVTGFANLVGGSGYTSAPAVTIAAPPATYQGLIQLQATAGTAEVEVTPDVVKLVDAAERAFAIPPYIGLPADRASSAVLKYEVPPAGLPSSPTAVVRVTFYGPPAGGTGTLPPIAIVYRRVTGASGSVPTSDTPLTLTTGQSLAAGDFVQVDSSSFAVAPGDTVYATISRAGSDGYTPEVGLLRHGLIITGG